MLKCSGIFDKIGGLILGKDEGFDDLDIGRKPYQVLTEVMGDLSSPIIAGFDSCNTYLMLTMPIGALVEMDADKKKVTLQNLS